MKELAGIIMKELADKIRKLVTSNNETVVELENALREARASNMEVELNDFTNTEVNHELDGLAAYKLKIIKISLKMPL